ncbi:MAG: hypothetical protein ACT4QG_15365 [Sporichthyaceae bacterium]
MTSPAVDLWFRGAFDASAAAELESAARACATVDVSGRAPVVHIDLRDVTLLDAAALDCLGRTWRLLTDRGWDVWFGTPHAEGPRLYFVYAVIRGEVEWARRVE